MAEASKDASNNVLRHFQRVPLHVARSTAGCRELGMNVLRLLCKRMINVQLSVMGCDEQN